MVIQYKEFKITRNNGNLEPISIIDDRDDEKLEFSDIIYVYYGKRNIYIGQTKHFYERHQEHVDESNNRYKNGTYFKVIIDFGRGINQLSLDDIEKQLITYITSDYDKTNKKVDNNTNGNISGEYQDKDEVFTNVIVPFWHILYKNGYVIHPKIDDIQNSILFKYSPFNTLPEDKVYMINYIANNPQNYLIEGLAGTGKTVVVTNLAAILYKKHPDAKIGVAVKSNWQKTGKKIFDAYGVNNISISTPNKIILHQSKFNYIIVDESHRLRRYYSKSNNANQKIFKKSDGTYDKSANELDMINKLTDNLILMYDPSQSIRPADIPKNTYNKFIQNNNVRKFHLSKEYRINVGKNYKDEKYFTSEDFINGILSFLQIDERPFNRKLFKQYLEVDEHFKYNPYFGVVNSIHELFDYLNYSEDYDPGSQNRVLAGFTKDWVSKKDKSKYDWIEGNDQWQWNSTSEDWINKKNSRNEIGSIHAIQGVDLNYAGVIISDDITVDDNGNIIAVPNNYKDKMGTYTKKDYDAKGFTDLLKHIYYVLLTRGIDGIRIYFEDKRLRDYFYKFMKIQ